MKISVILGHPYKGSFNTALAEAACAELKELGHTVNYHDLYSENFDPVMPPKELTGDNSEESLVRLHQQEIQEADGIIIVHPNWWGQPPAIIKGWVDRILRENVAYKLEDGDYGVGLPASLLKAKAGIVLNTSNTPADQEMNFFGDPLEIIWKNCVFGFCGIKNFERKIFRVISDSTLEDREIWIEEVRAMVRKYF